MRLVIDARMYGAKTTTGIGVYIEELVKQLADKPADIELTLITGQDFNQASLPQGASIRFVPTAIPWYSWAEQFKLPGLLAGLKPDLVHFPQFNVPIFYRGKYVVTIHDITPRFFPGPRVQRSLLRRLAFELTFRRATQRACKVITISQHTAGLLGQLYHIEPQRIAITPLGVKPSFASVTDVRQLNATLERYGIRRPYLLYVGVWRDHKNLPGLIRGFEILREQGATLQLVLAGQADPRYPEITAAIEQSAFRADIITPGFVPDDDLPALYSGAEVFVLPSFSEGFGLVALEAAVCGCPVAASRTTSVPEVLGEVGRYFDPQKPEDLAQTVGPMLGDPQLRASVLAARPSLLEKYQWSACALSTVEVYRDCGFVL